MDEKTKLMWKIFAYVGLIVIILGLVLSPILGY